MTDHREPGAPDGRAENALRAAFHRAAEATQLDSLDGPAIRRKARTRSATMVTGAAAAVLLLFGGVVGAVQLSRDPAATAADPADQTETSAIETPDKGWRFEYYRDVRLQVPDSWGYDSEPGSDWCAAVPGGMMPDQPYVARAEASQAVFDILCRPSGPPVTNWVDHVALSSAFRSSAGSSADEVGAFWVVKKVVGHVGITAVAIDRELADRIVASAEIVEAADPSCDPRSEIQAHGFQRPAPPFDITTLEDVDTILVCQYTFGESVNSPGLSAQYQLVGAAADRELEALQAAPIGGGPDQLENCVRGEFGESAIALHLLHGDASDAMYVYYGSCRGKRLRRRYGDQSADHGGLPAAHPAAGCHLLGIIRALPQVRY